MKRLFFIIGIILSIETYGQQNLCFFSQTNFPIIIYDSENNKIPFAVINQDSMLENYYSVEILNSSLERHLVRITSASSSSRASLEGWVDKKQCTVWLWPMDQDDTIHFYEDPILSSHYVIFNLKENSNVAASVLNISKGGWYHVAITNGKHSLSGWTKNVCTNIFGSCEQGNPYRTDW